MLKLNHPETYFHTLKCAKCSSMRLLYKISDIKLQEALAIFGCSESDISQKIFARKYFKIVYSNNYLQNPKKKSWAEANELDYAEAAKYYNSERMLPSAPHEVAIGQDITAKNLEESMNNCIKALYNFTELTNFGNTHLNDATL